ncbi:MAG: hypothetical protein JXI33_04975 [Candidatus Aminicenantes bacterium]|nr:hypothetical protein [Candidatus Aminicenantes bacterium]
MEYAKKRKLNKKMHRKETLPDIFKKWLADQNEKFVAQQLENKIEMKIAALGLHINNLKELEKQIIDNDKNYYALQETGNIKEYMPFFCKARLISAAKFLRQGKFDDAIFEYFHSFDTDDPNEIIKDLINMLQINSPDLHCVPTTFAQAGDYCVRRKKGENK